MSEQRGFVKTSLKGWTLNITIDLKKCVGKLLRGGMDTRIKGEGNSVKPRKVRKPRTSKAAQDTTVASPKLL